MTTKTNKDERGLFLSYFPGDDVWKFNLIANHHACAEHLGPRVPTTDSPLNSAETTMRAFALMKHHNALLKAGKLTVTEYAFLMHVASIELERPVK